jgi:hypothetical protein
MIQACEAQELRTPWVGATILWGEPDRVLSSLTRLQPKNNSAVWSLSCSPSRRFSL